MPEPVGQGFYDSSLTSPKDQVRFLLGDTGPNVFRIGDQEINYWLSVYGTGPIGVCDVAIVCTLMLIGAYGALSDLTVGGMNVNYRFQHGNFTNSLATLKQHRVYLVRRSPGIAWSPAFEYDGVSTVYDQNGPTLTNRRTSEYDLIHHLENIDLSQNDLLGTV